MPSAEPQPVLTPLTEAAIVLVLTVPAGGEDAVRDLLPDISGLRRSVGFRVPETELRSWRSAGRSSATWSCPTMSNRRTRTSR